MSKVNRSRLPTGVTVTQYTLTGSDGYPQTVNKYERDSDDGTPVVTWGLAGGKGALEPSADGNSLILTGTKIQFVLPNPLYDDDE
jgi:hypothetical protein